MSIEHLNNLLAEVGMEPLQDVDPCPERTAYLQHMSEPQWLDKAWLTELKKLTERYTLAFHTYVAHVYPYLRFEIGEDHCYWNYNPTTGIYDELAQSTVRGIIIKLLIREGLNAQATEAYVRNCLARFRAMYEERGMTYDQFDSDLNLFHARNGWVDVTTLSFTPHTPHILSRRVSAVDYIPDATCPVYDKFITTDVRIAPDAVRVIDQYSGLILTPDIRYQKMLTIVGRPGSGKSTLLDIWSYILGDMATQKRLTELSGDSARFAGANLLGKTLCWFDEVDVKRTEMSNNLGTLITGTHIRVERKGVNSIISGKNMLKCVLTANNLPSSSEHGMYRRIIFIEFNRSFYDEGCQINDLIEQLQGESSGILNRMIQGLQDLRKMRGFTVIAGHEDSIEEYKVGSDTIAEFLDTYFDPVPDADVSTDDLFEAYKWFADDKYTSSLTPQRFGRLLKAQPLTRFSHITAYKGVNGKRMWKGLQLKPDLRFDMGSIQISSF
jgi:putative DNA primase/helicase